jgi:hypothetical protein
VKFRESPQDYEPLIHAKVNWLQLMRAGKFSSIILLFVLAEFHHSYILSFKHKTILLHAFHDMF